jgi:hypothetical protein
VTDYKGLVLNLKEDIYHAHPSLSSSGAKLLLDSPATFDWVMNQGHRTEKAAFDFGSCVHAEVLGTGYGVEELDFDNYRTAKAQQARDEARAAGLIPMLKKDMEGVHATAQAVLRHPTARALLEREGDAEASVFTTDPITGVDIRCRFDFLPADRRVAVDLKTARQGTAKPHMFATSVVEYGYDVSWAHYTLTAELAGEPVVDMVFLVVETEPPFHILPGRLDDDFKEIGIAKARVARERYARALETGEWPGRPTDIQIIRPPQYAVYEHIDSQENAS